MSILDDKKITYTNINKNTKYFLGSLFALKEDDNYTYYLLSIHKDRVMVLVNLQTGIPWAFDDLYVNYDDSVWGSDIIKTAMNYKFYKVNYV